MLRPGGRLAVFDKFLPEDDRPSPLRRAALALLDHVFTSTNRQMGEILRASRAPFSVERDEPARGAYRHLLLRRIQDPVGLPPPRRRGMDPPVEAGGLPGRPGAEPG